MVCLLKNFTDIDIQEDLPASTLDTPGAHISRIKYYRNLIVHSKDAKVTSQQFIDYWTCIQHSIVQLSSDLEHDVDKLSKSSLNIHDAICLRQLELQIHHHQQILTRLDTESTNLKDTVIAELSEWEEQDIKYVPVTATRFIIDALHLKEDRGVIITGPPGCGKSSAAHYVALKLRMYGCTVIPIEHPGELVKMLGAEPRQVFVIDDICGKFVLDTNKLDTWDKFDNKLSALLRNYNHKMVNEESKTCVIITSLKNISSHLSFPNLSCFELKQCCFGTDFKLTVEELKSIALSYVPANIVAKIKNILLYDFFPLLCSVYANMSKPDIEMFMHPVLVVEREMQGLRKNIVSSFVGMALLVIFNNTLPKNGLHRLKMDPLIQQVFFESEIQTGVNCTTGLLGLERLKDIFIIKKSDCYTAIHDKMFDIVSTVIARYIPKCLMKSVEMSLISNRLYFQTIEKPKMSNVIVISKEMEQEYLDRQFTEIGNQNYWEVFGNIQTENAIYRTILLKSLKERIKHQKIQLLPSEDGTTPLLVASSTGYMYFVRFFVENYPHQVDHFDDEGRTPLFIACGRGHYEVAKVLMKFSKDIGQADTNGKTPLMAACFGGHVKVTKYLLDNKADANRKDKKGYNSLFYACYSGKVEMVGILLLHTQCKTNPTP